MRTIRRYAELGTFRNDWLNAHYHFSFSGYYDPAHMGLGPLRVINDDIVAPGSGFPPHPHQDMEIITYLRSGAISHGDHLGNHGRTGPGEVQVMSAGTGIRHSEHNAEAVEARLYQIWIEPNKEGLPPRWEQRAFPTAPVTDQLGVIVSGLPQHADSGALWIGADAALYAGRLTAGTRLAQPHSGRAYLLVSEGTVKSGADTLHKGDGLILDNEPGPLELQAETDAELILIDLPE